MSDTAKDLIKQLLNKNPLERPTIEEVKNHPFLQGNIPNSLPLSTLLCPPSSNYLKQFKLPQKEFQEAVEESSIQNSKEIFDILFEGKEKNFALQVPSVSKVIDVQNKWGFGYLLDEGTIGVYFNDKTSVVSPANLTDIYYVN